VAAKPRFIDALESPGDTIEERLGVFLQLDGKAPSGRAAIAAAISSLLYRHSLSADLQCRWRQAERLESSAATSWPSASVALPPSKLCSVHEMTMSTMICYTVMTESPR
jgi:hypothetical protein